MSVLSRDRGERHGIASNRVAMPEQVAAAISGPERSRFGGEGTDWMRSRIFEHCANPGCRTSWIRVWRSRSTPIFEDEWTCSPECTAVRLGTALARELEGPRTGTRLSGGRTRHGNDACCFSRSVLSNHGSANRSEQRQQYAGKEYGGGIRGRHPSAV